MLMALGRVTPQEYARDPDLRALIDIVPFGVPSDPPVRTENGYRESIPGIGVDDPLIIWGGSVLEWQDPVTVVEAMTAVVRQVPDARLVFPGGAHPNPEVPPMPVLERTRERARALGLIDRHVFFAPWMPYDERANYLLEANVGVSAHRLTLETRYAWRTRMLDYIWAGLPIVATQGDSFGDMLNRRGIGIAVPPADPAAMAAALVTLLTDRQLAARCKTGLAALRTELEWGTVVKPLKRFLQQCTSGEVTAHRTVTPSRSLETASPAPVSQAKRRLKRLLGY
jgi:glycosyltransferase involved in cell wall biosynthesis